VFGGISNGNRCRASTFFSTRFACLTRNVILASPSNGIEEGREPGETLAHSASAHCLPVLPSTGLLAGFGDGLAMRNLRSRASGFRPQTIFGWVSNERSTSCLQELRSALQEHIDLAKESFRRG